MNTDIKMLEEKLKKKVGEDKLPRGISSAKKSVFNKEKFMKLAEEVKKNFEDEKKYTTSSV